MIKRLQKIKEEKQEYRQMVARIQALPNDYQFVYEKIQKYMWSFVAGDGYDMVKIQKDLLELFESGVANGKHVLEITGEDVAAFCDGLLRNAKTYTEDRRQSLNRDIMKELGTKRPFSK